MQPDLKVEMGFVQRRLPWVIGAVALVLYLITANFSATYDGLLSWYRFTGLDWRPDVATPLQLILTYPFRFLPTGLQLPALNLLAAVAGALTLVLLARSVAILPHDRTREQRSSERSDYSMLSLRAAWLPPVLAAAVCGLQLSFWEHAIVTTGEMLDLLIFAWLVHTLLQYRLDERVSRLYWFAFVYGLSVTNNFAMIWFGAPFAAALVWIQGRQFFRWSFVLRLVACFLGGLLLYLLLPLLVSLAREEVTFWELLKSYLGFQRESLTALPRWIILLSSLSSLLPILFIGIRWPAQFGETTAIGNIIANVTMHLVHGIFLALCVVVAFDPVFSPRNLSGGMFALLPLYFLGALSVGYFAGYFLLVFGAKGPGGGWHRPSALRRVLSPVLVLLIWAAVLVVPAGLVFRNFPKIAANAGRGMERLTALTISSLPETPAVVLSDDRFQLLALEHQLRKARPGHRLILVDTAALSAPAYHRHQQARSPELWPKFQMQPDPKATISPTDLVYLIAEMGRKAPLYYLHPSFGYYFETFYLIPQKMVYELKRYPTNSLTAPTLTAAKVQEQDAFWRSVRSAELEPVIGKSKPFERLKPGKMPPRDDALNAQLGKIYSRALNHFGVEAQKSGNRELAGDYFELALRCSPQNPMAFANREYNQAVRNGKADVEKSSDEDMVERLKLFGGSWNAILGINGPIDTPKGCYQVANLLNEGQNFRQAAQYLDRSTNLDPTFKPGWIASTLISVLAGFPDQGLTKIASFRSRFGSSGISTLEEMDLLNAEAWAYVAKKELPTSIRLLNEAQTRYPRESQPWDTMVDIYLRTGDLTNAVSALQQQLKIQPENTRALINFGSINLRLGRPAEAVKYFEQALQREPKNEQALLNRALANQSMDRLDAAIQDFQALLRSGASGFRIQVLYGLAECYFKKKNRKESLRYYQDFLKAAPGEIPEVQTVRQRVKQLKSGAAL